MLKIEIYDEEITISLENGTEVVYWVEDEWLEDSTIVPAIANAIHMAHTDPKQLIALNSAHIASQEKLNNIPDK